MKTAALSGSRGISRALLIAAFSLGAALATAAWKQVGSDHAPTVIPPLDGATVNFSPKGGCAAAVVHAIDAAKHSILVQAYSFTSEPIAGALVGAAKRGVTVRIILDEKANADAQDHSVGGFCADGGCAVWYDRKHSIAHNKVMVIDDATVVTGSFNFTNQAEHANAENLLVLRSAALARAYRDNWQTHLAHSERWR